jgi:hypothetical protein
MQDDDTRTIDGIVKAFYEAISGRAGPRDWERDRKLLAPGAILVPVRPLPGGRAAADVLGIEGYIASRSAFFAANDLWEWETGRETFRSGNIAHLLSRYAAARRPADPQPMWTGVNSIQLYWDGERWWIVSVMWEGAVTAEELRTGRRAVS